MYKAAMEKYLASSEADGLTREITTRKHLAPLKRYLRFEHRRPSWTNGPLS